MTTLSCFESCFTHTVGLGAWQLGFHDVLKDSVIFCLWCIFPERDSPLGIILIHFFTACWNHPKRAFGCSHRSHTDSRIQHRISGNLCGWRTGHKTLTSSVEEEKPCPFLTGWAEKKKKMWTLCRSNLLPTIKLGGKDKPQQYFSVAGRYFHCLKKKK